jgi:hypothetical protein
MYLGLDGSNVRLPVRLPPCDAARPTADVSATASRAHGRQDRGRLKPRTHHLFARATPAPASEPAGARDARPRLTARPTAHPEQGTQLPARPPPAVSPSVGSATARLELGGAGGAGVCCCDLSRPVAAGRGQFEAWRVRSRLRVRSRRTARFSAAIWRPAWCLRPGPRTGHPPPAAEPKVHVLEPRRLPWPGSL